MDLFFPFLSFLSLNNSGTQLNGILAYYTSDLSSCLANCSNQGICILNQMHVYVCECNEYKTGISCQSDMRPCFSGPCLNNGICTNNYNQTSFECTCSSQLYFGRYCENKLDLCLNETTNVCIKGQGFCMIVNGSQIQCKCFTGYSGVKCELMSNSLMTQKAIISASTIIAIVVLVLFGIMILCFDFTKYFLIKNRKQKEPPKKRKMVIEKLHYKP